ncbi:MAG: hypothetical protein NDJ89_06365 [Oligoflexia bacterium]|nr:hypothetical protein [Oligoflexia bacterium]
MKVNLKFATLFIAIVLGAGQCAFAGQEIGNGGDAIVCRSSDGAIQRAELVDYYEAKIEREIQVDLGPGGSWQEQFEFVMKRLDRLDPSRATELRNGAARFLADVRFIDGHDFPDLSDTGGLIVPSGCRIEQVAIQQKVAFPQDKPYLINRDLWGRFTEQSKAGLVLHELLYREALENYLARNSRKVRYLNSLIASPLLEALSTVQYAETLAAAEIFRYQLPLTFQGQPALLNLNLGGCFEDIGTRTCLLNLESKEHGVIFKDPKLTDSAGNRIGIKRLATREGKGVQFIHFPSLSEALLLRRQHFKMTYALSLSLNRSTLTSKLYGAISVPGDIEAAFDGDGMLLDEVPLFTFNPTRFSDFFFSQGLIFPENRPIAIGTWSDSPLELEFRAKGGEIRRSGSTWITFENLARLSWVLSGRRHQVTRKPGCKESTPRLSLNFQEETWLDPEGCFTIEIH